MPVSILQIQTDLARLGYRPGPLDGAWGPKTSSALNLWRIHNNFSTKPSAPTEEDVAGLAMSARDLCAKAVQFSPAQLAALAPKAAPGAAQALQVALSVAAITSARAPYFLGQILHESMGLQYMHEIGRGAGKSYAPYYGRGLIQLTWRDNYRRAGRFIGEDLVDHPDRAAEPTNAGEIAAWYWLDNNLNAVIDEGQDAEAILLAVTKIVNGGTNGLKDRRERTAAARKLLAQGVAA